MTDISRDSRSLWKSFVSIAQPYFFPAVPGGAWVLLAIVLLLSLSVTGINVAFSYIGNFFTTALVKKNQNLDYLFVGVYFCGFLAGIPILALYGYVRDFLGMRWREWMTHAFLSNYFRNRHYYNIEAKG